jgi:hypothetical protein
LLNRLGGYCGVHEVSVLNGLSFNPLSFQQDCVASSEVDVGGCQVVDGLVVTPVVVVIDEGVDLGLGKASLLRGNPPLQRSKYCRKINPDAGGENNEDVKSQQIDLLMTDVTRTLNARAKRHRLSVDRHAIHRMRRSHVAVRHLLSTRKQAHTRPEAAVSELYASLAHWVQ